MSKLDLERILSVLWGLSYIFLAIFLSVAIAGYSGLDPSLNTVTNSPLVQNKMGPVGAYVADLSIQLLGAVSFLVVLLLILFGFNLLRGRTAKHSLYTRIIAFVFLIISCCTFVSKLFWGKNYWNYDSWGGALGYYMNNIVVAVSSPILLTLCLLVMLVSFHLLSDFNLKLIPRATRKICWATARIVLSTIKLPYKIIVKPFKKILMGKSRKPHGTQSHSHRDGGQKIEQKNENRVFEETGAAKMGNSDSTAETILEATKNSAEGGKAKKTVFSFFENWKDRNSEDKYRLPTLDLLGSPSGDMTILTKEELMLQAGDLLRVLREYKITGKIVSVKVGPIITLHEFEPSAGTKSARIIGCVDDIARNLKVESARISVMAEKNVLGIELPNRKRNTIFLRDILSHEAYGNSPYALPLVLGSDIAGSPVIMDLARAPHLLIAGTTGSGKSVCINAMILSLLYKFHPSECKMIMIDPKRLELSAYDGIPHLLMPVVTDSKKAVVSMKWIVNEMENRYRIMSGLGVRNIYGYNEKVKQSIRDNVALESRLLVGYDEYGEPIYTKKELEVKQLPFIVVIVDEMADLMVTAGKEIEALIQRVAQMARAAGIHIIMATQRPSVDIITGVIKANFPSRISFLVSSRIDSKVILGEQGAEQLLGMGDMLYMQNGSKINRAHGPFVSDKDVERVVDFISKQGLKPEYVKLAKGSEDSTSEEDDSGDNFDINIMGQKDDELVYQQALDIVKRDKRVSISYIQRQLRIGYNKAAILVERMEKEGIISSVNVAGKRDIL
ncbi:MAG: DNA translocase FtsK 4TM domain-containing protein [Rickettsiales bacterium]|jgi:S-DNA-T family DNA segregation ATPase FtsK/SpoIIIE|nr:DNA translocase FtsK 4TM domain-containing protein [Rickettsiales bacterium]